MTVKRAFFPSKSEVRSMIGQSSFLGSSNFKIIVVVSILSIFSSLSKACWLTLSSPALFWNASLNLLSEQLLWLVNRMTNKTNDGLGIIYWGVGCGHWFLPEYVLMQCLGFYEWQVDVEDSYIYTRWGRYKRWLDGIGVDKWDLRTMRGVVFCQSDLNNFHLQLTLPDNHQLLEGVVLS